MVPTNAVTGKTYYAGMKINNGGDVQYISFSVTTDFAGMTNIYNNGLTSMNTADLTTTTVALATI